MVKEYGTSAGVKKAWDTRGRGQADDDYSAYRKQADQSRNTAQQDLQNTWSSMDSDRKGAALADAANIMGWDTRTFYSMIKSDFNALPPQIQSYLTNLHTSGKL